MSISINEVKEETPVVIIHHQLLPSSSSSSVWYRKLRVCVVFGFLSMMLYIWIGFVAEKQFPEDIEQRTTKVGVVVTTSSFSTQQQTIQQPNKKKKNGSESTTSTTITNITITNSEDISNSNDEDTMMIHSSSRHSIKGPIIRSKVETQHNENTRGNVLDDDDDDDSMSCLSLCHIQQQQQQSQRNNKYFGSSGGSGRRDRDFTNVTTEMLQLVINARDSMVIQLKQNYGNDHFKNMFQEKQEEEWVPMMKNNNDTMMMKNQTQHEQEPQQHEPIIQYRRFFGPVNSTTGKSIDHVKRKLLIKILSVQSNMMILPKQQDQDQDNEEYENDDEEYEDEEEICNCNHKRIRRSKRRKRRMKTNHNNKKGGRGGEGKKISKNLKKKKKFMMNQQQQQYTPLTSTTTPRNANDVNVDAVTSSSSYYDNAMTKFVWVIGGHSAAAGHGNFVNETSIAFLNQAITNVFASIGIEFEGRNHAMGAYRSGGELSMCNEAIFGNDVDILTWDFGMTDMGATDLLLHYGYRTAVHVNRPALVALGGMSRVRMSILNDLERRGLPVLYDAYDDARRILQGVPDSVDLTEDELEQLPPYVRNFKCSESIESGDPYCGEQKYNMAMCRKRKGRSSWHPGWKRQAVLGNSIALFLANLLIDVLSDLVDSIESNDNEEEPFNPQTMLDALQLEEEELYSSFLQEELPESANPGGNIKDVNLDVLYKTKSICHTALLPSQARYLGYVGAPPKRNVKTGQVVAYETGLSLKQAPTIQPPPQSPQGSNMPIVYDPGERLVDHCSVTTKVDFKDFFYSHYNYKGWSNITIPNDAEIQAYNYDPKHIQGIILIRFAQCPKNKCKWGDIRSIQDGVEIQVNGKNVTSIKWMMGMHLLQDEYGQQNWPLNRDDRFEVSFRVTEENHYVRISSFVLY